MTSSTGSGLLVLHHLALGAQDVEVVASFYKHAFHLSELRRHQEESGKLRSIWLDMGGAVLMVEQTPLVRPRVEGLQTGVFLLAFSVPAAERQAVEARLTSLGAPPETRTEFTTYFRDPEGNRVAVSCYSFHH